MDILLKGLLACGFFHLSQKRPYEEKTIVNFKTYPMETKKKTHTNDEKVDYLLRIAFNI
jgi:hypothetical protein